MGEPALDLPHNRPAARTTLTAVSPPVRITNGRVILADFDEDGDADLDDYAAFWQCIRQSSPGQSPPQEVCLDVFDFDQDRDVDLADAAVFQGAFTGP